MPRANSSTEIVTLRTRNYADLAQHLGKEDVKVIAFRCSLPENMKQSSALDVLDYLCKHATFSPTNIQPLADLLTDAYRSDLVNNYVEEYRLKYGTAKYVDPYAILESYVYSSYVFGRFTMAVCEPIACLPSRLQMHGLFRTVHVHEWRAYNTSMDRD